MHGADRPLGLRQKHFCPLPHRMHETNPIARVTGTVRIGDLDIYNDITPVEIRRRVDGLSSGPIPFLPCRSTTTWQLGSS